MILITVTQETQMQRQVDHIIFMATLIWKWTHALG